MRTLPLAEIGVVAPFVAYLEEQGSEVNRHLAHANLSREMIDRGVGKIAKPQLYRFLQESARREGVPDLGYRLGERYGMRFLAKVGRSVLQAPTLKDAIETFAVHLAARLDGHHLSLQRELDSVWLVKTARDGCDDDHETSNQCGLLTLLALVREAAGPDWCPEQIRIRTSHPELHRRFEGVAEARVETTSAQTGLRFPAELLQRPVRKVPVTGGPGEIPNAGPGGFTAALERILDDQIPHLGVPTMAMAAEMANTSERTLQRRLGEEGLTYRRLIDRVRYRQARRRLLEKPHLQLSKLATELHYSGPSSLVRAFHRIAGCTPGAFVRQGHQPPGGTAADDAR